jgi:hypothetical protein
MLNIIGVLIKPLSIHLFINWKNRQVNFIIRMRIVMPSPSDVFQILKIKQLLLNFDKFKIVRVSSDQTKRLFILNWNFRRKLEKLIYSLNLLIIEGNGTINSYVKYFRNSVFNIQMLKTNSLSIESVQLLDMSG